MSTGGGSTTARGAAASAGGSVSAVGLATIGTDQVLIVKLDQPIPAGTSEVDLVLKITRSPAPAGGPTAAWCACNHNHVSCGIFII